MIVDKAKEDKLLGIHVLTGKQNDNNTTTDDSTADNGSTQGSLNFTSYILAALSRVYNDAFKRQFGFSR